MRGGAAGETGEDDGDPSVAAKSKRLGSLSRQRILDELPAALRAKIEPQLLIHVVADLLASRILHPLQNILDFLEMIVVVILAIGRRRIERGVDLILTT
jgi:hypothetical protein